MANSSPRILIKDILHKFPNFVNIEDFLYSIFEEKQEAEGMQEKVKGYHLGY